MRTRCIIFLVLAAAWAVVAGVAACAVWGLAFVLVLTIVLPLSAGIVEGKGSVVPGHAVAQVMGRIRYMHHCLPCHALLYGLASPCLHLPRFQCMVYSILRKKAVGNLKLLAYVSMCF